MKLHRNTHYQHTCRKKETFICNALARNPGTGWSRNGTGHSDYKAMKPYIDIADDIKANAMNKFNQL